MNSRPKVLVILIPGFASSEGDSSCLPMQQAFVRSISDTYPDVEVMVLSLQYPFVRSSYNWFGVSVRSFNGKNKGGVRRIFLRRRVAHALKEIQREKEIVGLLSFWMGECALIAQRFAKRNGLRHYCWLMGQDARLKNKYAPRVGKKGTELIALSDFLQEEFERNYRVRPGRVVYPGIDPIVPSNVHRDIELLGVGSLIPLKHYEVFLELVAVIRKTIPVTTAILVGEGPEYKKLKQHAEALRLQETVNFAGSISHDEVLQLMQRSRILLHPSSYEGFSGVCQEALSCGAHVISFCRAINQEINQWHIVGSREDMIEKTIALLSDPFMRYDPVEWQPMSSTAQQIMSCYL
jgi:glycosyltransferase involved in cell wall biosynthesis